MSIEDRNLKPGTVLVKRYKKRDYRCTVVKDEDGKLVYRVHGGKDYTSPSAAGSAVMGGTACNGWAWWNVEGEEKPKKAKASTKAEKGGKGAKRAPKTGTVAGAANVEPSETTAPAEQPVSCGDCGEEFPTSREAGDHMRDQHTSPEAAGVGG